MSLCLILSVVFFSACSTLRGLLGQTTIQRPQVDFIGAKLTGLSFDKASFLFDLKIRNPNSLGVNLAGFGYDLSINGSSFLKGRENKELNIEAQGESTFQIPLTLSYSHLYQVFQTLFQQDRATYHLKCDLSFNLPGLGLVQIPASKQGDFPLPKFPTVNVEKIELKRLGLSGADLLLGIQVNNPNAFSMIMEGMQYQLNINGQPWASGETGTRLQVTEKGESLLEIPIFLNFLQIGQSAYQALAEGQPLSYQFHGDVDLTTSLSLLGRTHLPFDRWGQIEVFR
jgi:LEA14-like dessication related protein